MDGLLDDHVIREVSALEGDISLSAPLLDPPARTTRLFRLPPRTGALAQVGWPIQREE